MLIEIRNGYTGKVIFSLDVEDNSIKRTVEEAVKQDIGLRDANLSGANLNYANLSGVCFSNANLSDADLSNAYLGFANLSGANLNHANLSGVCFSNANLSDADLSGAKLSDSNLSYADLSGANLNDTNLMGADLWCADLSGANLNGAKLSNAILSYADLTGANLSDANLIRANLSNADLSGANLNNANLRDADLRSTKNVPDLPMVCPKEGSFIGWKKIWKYKEDYAGLFIVKLEIPEDAKRSSATTNNCRCSKAKVLEIRNIDTDECVDVITNIHKRTCTYKVGEMVYPDSFDENRWNECSNGIHFFMTEKEARDY